jgi:molecular chaperone GrpE (heat shock protein)
LQWQDTVENSRRRDELISETGEQFGQLKDELDAKKSDLEQHKQRLDREKDNNRATEGEI